MNKRKRFSIPEDINRGIADVINAVNNNAGSFRYEVIALSRLETDPENPRELVLSEKDIQDGLIESDPDFVRKSNELEQLESLAHTIKQNGIINPISVYKCGEKYRIIAGERRFLAATLAKKNDIHARIIDSTPTDLDLRLLQWVENNERSDLSLRERLNNIRAVISEYTKIHNEPVTGDILKRLTGLSRAQSFHYLSVLDGTEDLMKNIENGLINNLDKAVLIKNANIAIRSELIAACSEGKSIKMLKEIIAKNKECIQKNDCETNKKNKKGRAVQYVHLGKTKNVNVIKKIFEVVLSHPNYEKHMNEFNLDWDDFKQVANGFKNLLSVIAGTEKG